MTKAVMIVFSHPASADVEDEYNAWYSDTHINDVLAIPGVTDAVRYRRGESGASPAEAAPYMTVIHIDTPDLGATLTEFKERPGTDAMSISPAFGRSGELTARSYVYERMSP
jgi:hypothetical protein